MTSLSSLEFVIGGGYPAYKARELIAVGSVTLDGAVVSDLALDVDIDKYHELLVALPAVLPPQRFRFPPRFSFAEQVSEECGL